MLLVCRGRKAVARSRGLRDGPWGGRRGRGGETAPGCRPAAHASARAALLPGLCSSAAGSSAYDDCRRVPAYTKSMRIRRPQHVNTPPSPATRGGTGIQPGQGIGQRFGGRNCVRNRRTKTAIRSSGLARLLQTCRRAPPIRKSNRRGPHSPATRSTDRGGEQT